jgi:hypothetical protein
LKAFENEALRRISGPKREEIAVWNGENYILRDFIIKSMAIRWVRYTTKGER